MQRREIRQGLSRRSMLRHGRQKNSGRGPAWLRVYGPPDSALIDSYTVGNDRIACDPHRSHRVAAELLTDLPVVLGFPQHQIRARATP